MKSLRIAVSVVIAAVVVYGVAFKTGRAPMRPLAFAVLVGIVLAGITPLLVVAVSETIRHRAGRLRRLASVLVLGGLWVAFGAGMANWLFSLQGLVILAEREAVPLSMTAHLQEFHAGPLSDVDEMRLTLQLVELELLPAGGGTFRPGSRLRVLPESGDPVDLRITPDESGAAGSLRFHQGAFGFAPRVVILRAGETVFDRGVPFVTERHGPTGVSFEGRFLLEEEGLDVEGSVDLASLDDGLRGHATLHMTVHRDGATLGSGSLLPGHFAGIEDGYRIGFAGLEKWSEIDISRRNYGRLVLAGLGATLAGAVMWPAARWRGW